MHLTDLNGLGFDHRTQSRSICFFFPVSLSVSHNEAGVNKVVRHVRGPDKPQSRCRGNHPPITIVARLCL